MTRLLKALLGSVFILLSLLTFYIFAGASDAEPFAAYQINALDPSGSWIDITLTLQPSPRPFVDLYLRDRSQGKDRVRDFSATRAGRGLATWQSVLYGLSALSSLDQP